MPWLVQWPYKHLVSLPSSQLDASRAADLLIKPSAFAQPSFDTHARGVVYEYLAGACPTAPVENDRCGVTDETLAHLGVNAAATQGIVCVCKFLAAVDKPGIMSPGVGSANGRNCEWLYGRVGSLYLLRLMRVLVPATAELPDIDPVV